MQKLALIVILLLAACSTQGNTTTPSQIPMANGVPLYGTSGEGHSQ